jgi:uncharacterized protein with HEPN domain
MLPSLKELLEHIRVEMDVVLRHTANLEFDDVINDEILLRGITRSFEIIGEASKKIPNEFRAENPEIDWKGMAGLRDKLIHHYFGVDYELV